VDKAEIALELLKLTELTESFIKDISFKSDTFEQQDLSQHADAILSANDTVY